jgi:PPM family protein phosphatase
MVVPDNAEPLRWQSAALTDVGRRRTRNEDAWLAQASTRVYAVADGMGGHAAGDVASRLAIETVDAAFARAPSPRIQGAALARRMLDVFDAANSAILAHALEKPRCAGMGTTLTVLSPLLSAPQCVIGHMGDSRAYRMRAGSLVQLTHDHTWVQQQVDAGMLTLLESRHHPLGNVLNRVLGTSSVGHADTIVVDVEPRDIFMLCTDGVTRMLDDDELRALLMFERPLEEHARRIIDAANARGGIDNSTVVLLKPEPA